MLMVSTVPLGQGLFQYFSKDMENFNLSIHIFRRDLRLDDNSGLLAALEKSKCVLPVFIFDERQLNNPYAGKNSFSFMMNSLVELDLALRKSGSRLFVFKGEPLLILQYLLQTTHAQAVFVNRDYTPFSLERDQNMANISQSLGAGFFSFADSLLTEPEQVTKDDGSPYTVFTPFMKKARKIHIPVPVENTFNNYYNGTIENAIDDFHSMFTNWGPKTLLSGGREEGKKLLVGIDSLDNYSETRNIPSVKGTSLLSAHHKFGTISVRETYHQILSVFDTEHSLINELYWRDFFTHVAFHFPRVFGNVFNEKYANLAWENDETKFGHWCSGTTGFPIVDAGMRELVATGFMHNRVRMVVASFLTKDLHIDWRWGERFFANHLIDYDPSVNNGNWQWAASTGCDAQPWFRIFNPWSQQQKFDPDGVYCKKWIPELAKLSANDIHNLTGHITSKLHYPPPIVDHASQVTIAKAMFSNLK